MNNNRKWLGILGKPLGAGQDEVIVWLAKNEIYARHGRTFLNEGTYFIDIIGGLSIFFRQRGRFFCSFVSSSPSNISWKSFS